MVAIYGRGKPLLRNLAHVRAHREACSNHLADGRIDRVLAVGVRPVSQNDDPIVYDLLRQLGSTAAEKVYVGPAENDCGAFEAIGRGTSRRSWG